MAAIRHPNWPVPSPVHDLTFGPTTTVALTWTLLPPDNAVVNGEFEAGIDGWSTYSGEPDAPAVVTEPVHTGRHALSLRASEAGSGVVGVTQTVALTDVWEPVLSFWYVPGGDGDFRVSLTIVTQTLSSTVTMLDGFPGRVPVTTTLVYTPSLAGTGWQHWWTPLGPADRALTGSVEMRFEFYSQGEDHEGGITIDEVSLGGTPGGPFRMFLPLVSR